MMSPYAIFLLYFLVTVSQTIIITTACGSVPLADCEASGYCELAADKLTCIALACYKINEIGACKDPTSVAYSSPNCLALTQLDLRYDNVCSPNGIIDYAFVRLPIIKTGSPIYSTTGMTLTEISTQTDVTIRNNLLTQLFSLNLQTATNTELIAILDLYIAYADDMIGVTGFAMSHPYYLEKAIFSALQNLRDDTDASKDKTTTLTRIWTISDTLFTRLKTFRKFYATSYFFINFAHTLFSRTYLSVKAQYSVFSLKWKSYTSNGYVQLITLAPNQFTLGATALSDLIMFNIVDTTNTAYTLEYTLSWLVTDLTQITCAVETTGRLHVVDRISFAEGAITPINIYCASTATSKRCDIPSTVIDTITTAGNAFYIACS